MIFLTSGVVEDDVEVKMLAATEKLLLLLLLVLLLATLLLLFMLFGAFVLVGIDGSKGEDAQVELGEACC